MSSKDLAKKVITDIVVNSKEHADKIANAELSKASLPLSRVYGVYRTTPDKDGRKYFY